MRTYTLTFKERQTKDRQVGRDRDWQRDRQARHKDRDRDRETSRDTERQTDKQADKDRHKDKRQRQRNIKRYREADRHTDIERNGQSKTGILLQQKLAEHGKTELNPYPLKHSPTYYPHPSPPPPLPCTSLHQYGRHDALITAQLTASSHKHRRQGLFTLPSNQLLPPLGVGRKRGNRRR